MAPSTGVAAAPGAGLTYTPSTSGRSGSNIYGSSGTYGYGSTTGAPGYGTSGGSSTGYPSGYSSFTPASAAAPPRCCVRTKFVEKGPYFLRPRVAFAPMRVGADVERSARCIEPSAIFVLILAWADGFMKHSCAQWIMYAGCRSMGL